MSKPIDESLGTEGPARSEPASEVAIQIRVRARAAQIKKDEGLTWREAAARAAEEVAREFEEEKSAPRGTDDSLARIGRALALPVCTAIEMAVVFFIAAKLTHPLLLSVFTESQLANSSFAGVLFLIIAFVVGIIIGALFPAFQNLVVKDRYALRLAIDLAVLAFLLYPTYEALRPDPTQALEYRLEHGQVDPNLAYGNDQHQAPTESLWSELKRKPADEIIAIAERFPDLRIPRAANGEVGSGPLHEYAEHRDGPRLIEYFLKRGFSPKDESIHGNTPLHRAAQIANDAKRAKAVIDLLLAAGADINAHSENYGPPLTWTHDPEIARYLIAKGADVNLVFVRLHHWDQGRALSVLDYLEKYDKLSPAKEAIRAWGGKPADQLPREKVQAALAEAQAREPAKPVPTPRSSAKVPASAESLDDEMRRAELNARSAAPPKPETIPASQPAPVAVVMESTTSTPPQRGESTALHAAVREDDLASVKSLLGDGADIQAADPAGQTPLMLAVARVGEGYYDQLDVVRYLLDKGAAVNVRDVEGKPVLMYAGPDWLLLQLLAGYGADPNLGHRGRSVWHQLADEGFQTVAGVAGRFKAIQPPLDREGKPCAGPLHVFAAVGKAQIVRYFLQRGVSPRETDASGRTPLHALVSSGNREQRAMIEIVDMLAANGADVNARDRSGLTALNFAGATPEVARRLTELGADAGGLVKQ